MKKLFSSLPFRLLLALAVGILFGQFFGEGIMKVVVSLQYVLGQLIMFCVPLIVIGTAKVLRDNGGYNSAKMQNKTPWFHPTSPKVLKILQLRFTVLQLLRLFYGFYFLPLSLLVTP